ncbi:MAG: hypothetical protein JO022_05845, partial [Acidobacteriaceae bacterium]|nr:hypothetical protein [Acidobacteriaceae bacterium]
MAGLVVCLAAALDAQTVNVRVASVSSTQALVNVSATNNDGSPYIGPCTYRVSEGSSFTSLINDVNPALFPGADNDSRPGATINGSQHTFVIGTRLAAKAADNKFYSRALQTDTTHWVGVTCGSASEKSATFRTIPTPLGNSYPEWPAWDPSAFGNFAIPTVDFADTTKTYIDPLTGVLLKRISGPLDATDTYYTGMNFTTVLDLSNGAWQNAGNAISNQGSGAYASTRTPNAAIFLPWAPGTFGSAHASFDNSLQPEDVRLKAYCSGSNGGTLQACISLDGGQTCASGALDLACPTSFGEVDVPNNYPTPLLAGWGTGNQILTKNSLSTFNTPTVNVSGNTVTWVGEPVKGVRFYAYRAPGSKLQISGTAPYCANNICTVVNYSNPTQITIQENVPGSVTGTMQDMGAGVRVWLKNTGGSPSVSASFTYDWATTGQFFPADNSSFDSCSNVPITDINTDAAGNPLSSPLTGNLCTVGRYGGFDLFLWIPSTGESRLMSTYATGNGPNFNVPPQ